MKDYLSLPQAFAVGGPWLASKRDRRQAVGGDHRADPRGSWPGRPRWRREPLHPRKFPAAERGGPPPHHDYAAKQPILDYHTHLPPDEIAADRRWENISQVWLNGDHYKWRQMRANGIAERFCTGDATDREKFDAFAGTSPTCCAIRSTTGATSSSPATSRSTTSC